MAAMPLKSKKKLWTLRILGISLVLFVGYLGLLNFPNFLFPYRADYLNLNLYSDEPFEPGAGVEVLKKVYVKLSASPLFDPEKSHSAFVCQRRWRQILFFNRHYGVGGVSDWPLTGNVFLRNADISADRLISPHGQAVEDDRPFDYFVAHEITHCLTGKAVGPGRYFQLPKWKREGYADYIGKGKDFDFAAALQAFHRHAPEMDHEKSGLYLRYHLLVAYLLDEKGWSLEQFFESPMSQETIERALK